MITFVICLLIRPGITELLNITDTKGIGEQARPFHKFVQYIVNNGITVPLQMFILALIPIPFLYYLPVALTSVLTGFILYLPFSADLHGKMSFIEVVFGMAPHALIEFAAYIILLGVQYHLNTLIRLKLLHRETQTVKIGKIFKKCGAVYLLSFVIVIIGAGVEAFITPLISKMTGF